MKPKTTYPGWRAMTAAQRHNAKQDRIWAAAKDAQTRFNATSQQESSSSRAEQQ